ncbi:hypothetical protein L841_0065 [Mycobacterium sp. MAC_080597_8934]|nr:hypothetical protein L840_2880 [Mycobacterium sp. MAC_011194_8550]ETZ75107.1 hypothetical protein L841_0065 [Mycobacterium sp. MAC_080597_8934]
MRSQARRLSPGAAGRPHRVRCDRKRGACRRAQRVALIDWRRSGSPRSIRTPTRRRVTPVMSVARAILSA